MFMIPVRHPHRCIKKVVLSVLNSRVASIKRVVSECAGIVSFLRSSGVPEGMGQMERGQLPRLRSSGVREEKVEVSPGGRRQEQPGRSEEGRRVGLTAEGREWCKTRPRSTCRMLQGDE